MEGIVCQVGLKAWCHNPSSLLSSNLMSTIPIISITRTWILIKWEVILLQVNQTFKLLNKIKVISRGQLMVIISRLNHHLSEALEKIYPAIKARSKIWHYSKICRTWWVETKWVWVNKLFRILWWCRITLLE